MPGKTAGGGSAKRHSLVQRRKALGLTQEALAGLLGVERTTVARWERGETEPQPWIRPELAAVLRVPADRLEELLAGDRRSGSRPQPGTGRDRTPTTPRQLPATVADFTGRAAELRALTQILDEKDAGTPGTVVISAIGGTAGVGKTALALHWAHQVANRFPDGQLHVNLRGFDPSGNQAAPTEAVRGFLDALGVQPERIPAQQDAQVALFRTLLADKQMLIVLDNARDEQQVRPILPASPASLVLVTSRNQLTGLAADGARLVSLDVLTRSEAVQLLTARLGTSRAAAETEAVNEIASLCAYLPLALAVSAARAAARPDFPLATLANELRGASGRLDALDAGYPAASVRAVFSWSYSQLSSDAARMFRLLGLHPGPDISVRAAASLAAVDEPQARGLLRDLARDCLICEHVFGRYAFHDLLRAYAADKTRDCDSQPDRDAATGRILDHYLHTAARSSVMLFPSRDLVTVASPRPGTAPEQPADIQQALAWFEAEHDVLSAAVACASGSGFDRHAWQLAWAISDHLGRCGLRHEQVFTLETGLAAATRLGDTTGQAVSCLYLASAYFNVGDYGQADAHVRRASELYRRLGDRLGEGKACTVRGFIAEGQGRYGDSIRHYERALHLFRAIGLMAGEAQMLNNIGWICALLGDYQRARAFSHRSLALSTEHKYRHLYGATWDSLGYIAHHLGDLAEAAACYERSISMHREFGERLDEAIGLGRLGDTRKAAGELAQARNAWMRALAILDDLAHPDAEKVRAKLADIAE